jgi:teichuronic acid exporter
VILRQGIQFFIAVALARMLTPEEFGTIAVLYLFTGVANVLVDGGFQTALIRDRESTHLDESTVFWFAVLVGAVLAVALAASAPLIARFFRQPILTPLTGVMALNLFVGALGSVHSALLTKRLDFKTPMAIGAVATVVSGSIAVAMAWTGFGVWALAAQVLVSSAITTLLFWKLARWRPALAFSKRSLQRLFGFGGYVVLSGLIDAVYSRFYTVLLGRLYGVRDLAFYTRADTTKQLPISVMTSVLSRVALPIFSEVSLDPQRLRRGVRQLTRSMMLLNVALMLGIWGTADALVQSLFGPRWLPSVPLLQVLCLAGIFWPLHVINLNTLMAQGHSHLFFRVELAKKAIGLVLLFIGVGVGGVMGAAWSQVAFGAVAFCFNAHYTKVHLDYGAWDQTKDFLPALGIATVMGVVVHVLGTYLTFGPLLTLFVQTLCGAALFVLGCLVFRIASYQETQALILNGAGGTARA